MDQVVLRCAHAKECGGCSLPAMSYGDQVQRKEAEIRSLFSPCAPSEAFLPIMPCADPWRYRNKMEFSFSQNLKGDRFLGLMMPKSRGKVVNLSECHLVATWFSDVLHAVRAWWSGTELAAYRMNDTGALRTLTVREGMRTNDKMAMLTVSGNPNYPVSRACLSSFVRAVQSAVEAPERLSIFLRVQQIQKGHPTQFYELHLAGPDHLIETLDVGRQLLFKISPTSFFQPNTQQAEQIYRTVVEWAQGADRALDLYAGTSTIGLALAGVCNQVVSIEINPYAVFDARTNQEMNGIKNLTILQGDVGVILKEHDLSADLVVVDPPRAGLSAEAIAQVLRLYPEKIISISCNPKTQALNVQDWVNAGYCVEKIQPIDQFPHTMHVENIVLLRHT